MSGTTKLSVGTKLIGFLERSSKRCHAIGVVLCLMLLGMTAWVNSYVGEMMKEKPSVETQMTEEAAIVLAAESDHWHRQFAKATAEESKLFLRKAQIGLWAPTAIQWNQKADSILQLARVCGVKVLGLSQESSTVGSRVGVQVANCSVTGSFATISNFIGKLHRLEQSVWCSRMTIQRAEGPANDTRAFEAAFFEDENPRNGDACTCSLELRVPFSAANTASGTLAKLEASDGE